MTWPQRRIAVFLALAVPGVGAAQRTAEPPAGVIADVRGPPYFAVLVRDAEAAATWYQQTFGLRELDRSQAPDGTWQIINLMSPALLVEVIRDDREPMAARGRGFVKVGFTVADVAGAAAAIGRATGTTPRVLEFPQHGIRVIQVEDPDGNIIQLSSPLPPR